MLDPTQLSQAMSAACVWLTGVAQVRGELGPKDDSRGLHHRHWDGAMRGEYRVAERQWQFFCPVWHSGQAIKALVQAHQVLKDPSLLEAAKRSADFVGAERQDDADHPDFGLIHAYEDHVDAANTSAILEALDGLFLLADATGDEQYRDWALAAVDWVARKAYERGTGLFHDVYHPMERTFYWIKRGPKSPDSPPDRPLLDDAIFLKAHAATGNPLYREFFFEVADHLLKCERPSGNWVKYGPSREVPGYLHPRAAYWWGLPMLDAWRASGERRYLDCAVRVAQWCVRAMRRDGGMFRNTYLDFNTDSFGHATSGSACAAIILGAVDEACGLETFRPHQELALDYCMKMQFRHPADPNLRGAILEKVLPPDGSDRSPYYIRDLGTIFLIQAAAQYLLRHSAAIGEKGVAP